MASAPRPLTADATAVRTRRLVCSEKLPTNGETKMMLMPRMNWTRPSWKGESVSWATSHPWPICSIQKAKLDAAVPPRR